MARTANSLSRGVSVAIITAITTTPANRARLKNTVRREYCRHKTMAAAGIATAAVNSLAGQYSNTQRCMKSSGYRRLKDAAVKKVRAANTRRAAMIAWRRFEVTEANAAAGSTRNEVRNTCRHSRADQWSNGGIPMLPKIATWAANTDRFTNTTINRPLAAAK